VQFVVISIFLAVIKLLTLLNVIVSDGGHDLMLFNFECMNVILKY
jgi:hypothetical protein